MPGTTPNQVRQPQPSLSLGAVASVLYMLNQLQGALASQCPEDPSAPGMEAPVRITDYQVGEVLYRLFLTDQYILAPTVRDCFDKFGQALADNVSGLANNAFNITPPVWNEPDGGSECDSSLTVARIARENDVTWPLSSGVQDFEACLNNQILLPLLLVGGVVIVVLAAAAGALSVRASRSKFKAESASDDSAASVVELLTDGASSLEEDGVANDGSAASFSGAAYAHLPGTVGALPETGDSDLEKGKEVVAAAGSTPGANAGPG